MSLRAVRRAVPLGFALFRCILRYWSFHMRGPLSLEKRAEWLQSACRIVVSSLGIRCVVKGELPSSGIVVSNHLSYLDIAIYSSVMKCFFVSKDEVNKWPYFGQAARSGGTIFLDRSRRASAAQVAAEIAQRLQLPVPILFFPEGTSTDGSSVLRFHSGLFEPAIVVQAFVTAASIRYILVDGTPERELCWFGDEGFLSHLWKTLCAGGFTAEVRFGKPRVYPQRRAAANQTHEEVVAMRAGDVIAQEQI